MKMTVGIVATLAVAGGFAWQFKTIAELQMQVTELRQMLVVATPVKNLQAGTSPRPAPQLPLGGLPNRVTQLEQTVADLSRTSDLLMERGVVPPSEERMATMQQKFFDPNATDRERMRALQLMRRQGPISDEVAMHAMNWLQSSTNSGTRRDLLRQLDGATNATIRAPLIALLGNEANGGVREQLVDVLADFVSDPAVESRMWDLAANDPDEDVREEAEEALTRGPMTPERLEALKQKATNADAPLETRLLALQGLSRANGTMPAEALTEIANLAQSSPDPVTRARLYDAFDKIHDPSLMLPLVNGLQDPSPVVRERAADALSEFNSDERIKQWLTYVIQNDSDPRVVREAHEALEQSRRRARR